MRITRRQAIGALGGTALLTGAGCGRLTEFLPRAAAVHATPMPQDPAPALLNRFAFGPTAREILDVREKGVMEWLEAQMAAPQNDPPTVMFKLRRLDIFNLAPFELADLPARVLTGGRPLVVEQLNTAAIIRAVESPWQLRERMVDFWTNHFSIYGQKMRTFIRVPLYERDVIRPNVFGNFLDLLTAVAKSAAMLVYLDNNVSRRVQPNENFARELLELHTLGVDGGFTQQDVMEVARCFTGWTEETQRFRGQGRFRFVPAIHDRGAKTVLGHRIPAGGGIEDGLRVLEILAQHPNTARNLARKFATAFGGADDPVFVEKLAQTFTECGGDTRAMLRRLVKDGYWMDGPRVLKRPFDLLASAIRALDGQTDGQVNNRRGVQDYLVRMGQGVYEWPRPDGYPWAAEKWARSVLPRWHFAHALAHNEIPGTPIDLDRLGEADGTHSDRILERLFHVSADDPALSSVRQAIRQADRPDQFALALSSPAFQWR